MLPFITLTGQEWFVIFTSDNFFSFINNELDLTPPPLPVPFTHISPNLCAFADARTELRDSSQRLARFKDQKTFLNLVQGLVFVTVHCTVVSNFSGHGITRRPVPFAMPSCTCYLMMLYLPRTLQMDESTFLTLSRKVLTASLCILSHNVLPLIAGHLPKVNCMEGLLQMRLNVAPQFATVCQLCLTRSDWLTVFWKMKKSLKWQKSALNNYVHPGQVMKQVTKCSARLL